MRPNEAKEQAGKITGARFMAETLKGYGITHVFFVEAILRYTLKELEALGIRRVLTHSEKAAAYMADGYARASRKFGVCMSQSVGAANIASGLQDAFLGASPVIALTGRALPIAQHRHAYQEIDHAPLFDAVTKFKALVETPDQLPYLLRQAIREAMSGTPGPVHLDVMDLRGETLERAEGDWPVVIEEPFTHLPPFRPEPEARRVDRAVELLTSAERPVIVAGGGATVSQAGPEILKLAQMLSIPVATSLNGKGSIPEDHPLSLGVVGVYSRWCANRIVAEADLVFFVGSRTGDLVTNAWRVPKPGTPVIQIDIHPAELGRSYPNAVALFGDAKITLQRMISRIKPKASPTPWAKHAQELVQRWWEEVEPFSTSSQSPIRPERLCREIAQALPPDGILVADTGLSAIWTGTLVPITQPSQRYIRCAGSLGWGFPGALGVKCALPDRAVICFTGDGGFFYHLSELETARRCGIHTVTVINNNHCLRQCMENVHRVYGEDPGKREELYDFREVNFAKIAEEMGCVGFRVEEADQLAPVLQRALKVDAPAVVDVVTAVDYTIARPWAPM
jgi:acetolactate synthase-1/2/3 large subunit